MKTRTRLSNPEREVVKTLESIGNWTYDNLRAVTSFPEAMLFNVLQALIIRGIVKTNGQTYTLTDKQEDTMETVKTQANEVNKEFQNIAMDARDFKIYMAMMSNLESFVKDAHQKAKNSLNPTFTVAWSIKRELTQKERDIAFLEELREEAIENELTSRIEELDKLIERVKEGK